MNVSENEKDENLPMVFPNSLISLPAYHYYQLLKKEGAAIIENRVFEEKNGVSEFSYELISPEGIHFWHYSSDINEKKTFGLENPLSFIQIVFSIYNTISYKSGQEQIRVVSLANYEYNILYFPPQKSIIEWDSDDKKELFVINLVPEIFGQYLQDHPFLDRLEKFKGNALAAAINEQNLPITPAIRTILYDILNCPLDKNYKRLYFKAKVLELLAVLLSHYENYDLENPDTAIELRKTDIDKMQLAREILHENITNPCSLIDLAHQVGTNENYLKKHFKQVFGNTVYGYIHELRMQQAKQLLVGGEKSINEIGRICGYKHTYHFIAAFKKYFGYVPNTLNNPPL